MSHQDDRAAGAPGRRRRHASARRGPGPRLLLAGGGILGLGLLVAVVSGAFRSGQAGGSAPTGDGGRPGLPALIQADPADGPSQESSATGVPTPTGAKASASASEAAARPTASGEATARPTATGDGSGSSDGSDGSDASTGVKPGKSASAPGKTKRPR